MLYCISTDTKRLLRHLLVTCDKLIIWGLIMFLKSLRCGFKCSVCGTRSLSLTHFGGKCFCKNCVPRYVRLISSLAEVDSLICSIITIEKEYK